MGALLLAANVFLLLTAYYILKTVRESLILAEGGAEVKACASAGQAALLLLVIPAYGWLANRLTRFRLVAAVMLVFLSNLPVFYFLNRAGVSIGIPFYLWLGIFSVMALAQFWAFASDLYTEDQGKRLFPILGLGSSLGALAGARVAAVFFGDLGIDRLLLVGGAIMLGSLVTWHVNRRAGAACAEQRKNDSSSVGTRGAFEIVGSDRYLRLIAGMVVLLNVVNTGAEYLLSKLVVADATRAAIGAIDPVAAAWLSSVSWAIEVVGVDRTW
jgi:AAA family ATP:ADP antiporter